MSYMLEKARVQLQPDVLLQLSLTMTMWTYRPIQTAISDKNMCYRINVGIRATLYHKKDRLYRRQ